MSTENRQVFHWAIFILIYSILVGGIGYAAFGIYGANLGAFVAGSAAIAGLTSLYLWHVEVRGETLMKIILGLAVAANAAYLVHNGARAAGVQAFNDAQVRKYEAGAAAAARAKTLAAARQIGLSAGKDSQLEKMFGSDVAAIAAFLAFLELSSAMVIFAVASKRQSAQEAQAKTKWGKEEKWPEEVELDAGESHRQR